MFSGKRGWYIAETTKGFGVQSLLAANSTTKIQAYTIMKPWWFAASHIPREVAASNAKYIIHPLFIDYTEDRIPLRYLGNLFPVGKASSPRIHQPPSPLLWETKTPSQLESFHLWNLFI